MTSRPGVGRGRPVRLIRLALIAPVLAMSLVVGGCGGSTSASPSPTSTPSAPGPSGSGGPAPRATPWPASALEAIKALGAADNEISRFLADYAAAVQADDLPAMWGAADGLARMLDTLMPNIDRLEAYPPMQGLAAKYRASFPPALAAARLVRDSIDAHDADGIERGSVELFQALTAYGELKAELAGWIEQSIQQQRLLVR